MDLEIFKELGLSESEIKIYVTLLGIGSSTAGEILTKSKLQNSVVHRALNSLIEKSLISFISEGKRRIYSSIDPENFYDFIEEKKKKFTELLPELKKKQKRAKVKEAASIFKGIRGIKEVYNFMINQKGKEYLTYGGGKPCANKMGDTWWLNMHQKRIANKLKARQVFDKSILKVGSEIAKLKFTNVRYLPEEFAQFQETVIVGNYVSINVFSEEPYSFLIHDRHVADGYRKHFEILWKRAK
jgi:sugar-specific transcriptional regulator TrmB